MDNGGRWAVPAAFLAGCFLVIFLLAVTSGLAASPPAVPQAENLPAGAAASGQESSSPQAQEAFLSSGCLVSAHFPEAVRAWCEPVTRHAIQNGLEPDLLAALIWQESGGDPNAYSHSGAVGLMQVMPRDGLAASFMCSNGPCFQNRPAMDELFNPEFNLAYGTHMLAELIHKYGSLREALKSYGPMDVGYDYADIVLGLYERHRD